MGALAKLRAPVDAFFDKVLVNAPDPAVRANRLRLLNRIREATLAVADFSKIAGRRELLLANSEWRITNAAFNGCGLRSRTSRRYSLLVRAVRERAIAQAPTANTAARRRSRRSSCRGGVAVVPIFVGRRRGAS